MRKHHIGQQLLLSVSVRLCEENGRCVVTASVATLTEACILHAAQQQWEAPAAGGAQPLISAEGGGGCQVQWAALHASGIF